MKAYYKKHRAYFAGALIYILISTLLAVTLQFFKGEVLDHAAAGDTPKTIHYALLLIVFILGEVVCYYRYRQLGAKFSVGCAKALKQDIFESILRRSYVEYKRQPHGAYISKYTTEADNIQNRHFNMLPTFWEILFMILLVSIALFVLDWRIAVITITLLTTPLYVPKLIEKRLQRAQAAYLQEAEKTLTKVNDWLAGFEIIKNYAIEKAIVKQFKTANDETMKKLLQDTQLSTLSQLITTLISYLSYFIVLICAAGFVLSRDFSAGDFFVAIGMIDQLSYPLISLAGIIRQLIAVKPACAEMTGFISTCHETIKTNEVTQLQSEIRFDNVSFSYDEERPILQGFDLTIEKGKRYLLKGPSGCGKTTAVNLLLRYYDVSKGRILIDGQSIEEVTSTYGCMTVVRQEATLFCDTLRNNLTMYQNITDEHLISTLESVGLSHLANADSLDSQAAENGTNFSGGEKKRICLARALLRNTDVLILDEPLANLDPNTAGMIEDLLLEIKDKTIIIVSHQFTETKLDYFDQVVSFTAQ